MKYVARVSSTLRPGIHAHGEIIDGEVRAGAELPLPDRVEIEANGEGAFIMNRYTSAGEYCGDTWHRSLEDAFAQAALEYGLTDREFLRAE